MSSRDAQCGGNSKWELIFNILSNYCPILQKHLEKRFIWSGISIVYCAYYRASIRVLLFTTDKGLFLRKHGRQIGYWFYRQYGQIHSVYYFARLAYSFSDTISRYCVGPAAASVSLSAAAIPFFARIVETSLREIDKGVIEAAISIGATPWMIIQDVLLPEAKTSIIQGLTLNSN